MAISNLPNYTLPASQFLSSITTFVNQLRFKDTLKATSMVKVLYLHLRNHYNQ